MEAPGLGWPIDPGRADQAEAAPAMRSTPACRTSSTLATIEPAARYNELVNREPLRPGDLPW
jgi:hypothetical protein